LAFKRTWTLWFKVAQAGEQARRYSISLGTRVAAARTSSSGRGALGGREIVQMALEQPRSQAAQALLSLFLEPRRADWLRFRWTSNLAVWPAFQVYFWGIALHVSGKVDFAYCKALQIHHARQHPSDLSHLPIRRGQGGLASTRAIRLHRDVLMCIFCSIILSSSAPMLPASTDNRSPVRRALAPLSTLLTSLTSSLRTSS
jgi:hypothetical protein